MDETPQLDRLVSQLNSARLPRNDGRRLEAWLAILRAEGGSDLYLVAGLPPSIRVHGGVRQLPESVLDGDDIEENVLAVLPPHAIDSYRTKGHADASLRQGSEGRVRINLHRERGRAAASIRALPMRPPQLSELSLHQEMTITRRDGSFTFEESLAQLVRRGLLTLEDARSRSMHREELDGLLVSASKVRRDTSPA